MVQAGGWSLVATTPRHPRARIPPAAAWDPLVRVGLGFRPWDSFWLRALRPELTGAADGVVEDQARGGSRGGPKRSWYSVFTSGSAK